MLAEKDALLAERERIIAEKEALFAERERAIAVRDAELYAKTVQIEHLKAQLAVLRRARFGRSSEKLDREIEQLELLLGDLEEGLAESTARVEQTRSEAAATTRAKPTAASRAAASRCPRTSRASAWCTSRRQPAAVAAGPCCAGSPTTSPRCWNTFPPRSR